MNNTICKAFINHLCLTVEQEKIPCCRFIGKELIKQDNGWYTGCSKCYDEEQRNQKSYRQILNEQLSGKQGLEYLEFSLSSQCNLACKMCDPTYSTTWEKLCNQYQPLQEYKSNNNTKSISVKELFKNVDYSKLILIKYLGGEPFITPQLKELIYFLDQKNIIQNITFWTNTNITIFPKKLIPLLKKFKKVNIALSLDGIGALNEYIRYGKSWSVIEKNVNKWVSEKNKNFDIWVHTTVQAYNFHALSKIKQFCDEKNLFFYGALLSNPDYLHINVLPESYIKKVQDEVNEKYLNSYNFNESDHNKFIDFTRSMDKATNQNVLDIMPLFS